MLKIESGLVLLALLIAGIYPALGRTWFEKLERRFSALARRRALSVLLVGVTALALRAAVLPIEPIPEPIVHDEFGYLLAADTFAHGRLTNPTPPLWEHFETFHVMFHPTYASIYPPAQGFFLALGKVLFGHPFWGVWLSVGLMCAAITWMLQGWIGPEWALLGGLIAVLRYGVFGYWADSYWGGAVAAIGGALVLGALPRIKESQRVGDAVLMGVGLAILANSRPYEGFIFSLPVAVILFVWMCGKKRPPFSVTLGRVVAPLVLMLALTAAGMGYYLWRVTGSPVRMPYQVERQTNAITPFMIWQKVRPEPVYHHAVMRRMYTKDELASYNLFRSPLGLLFKLYLAWTFFLGPTLTLPLLMLSFSLGRDLSWRDIGRPTRILLFLFLVSALGWAVESFYSPHYSSQATGMILLFILISMRHLRSWGASGLFLARGLALICVVSFALRAAAVPLHIPLQGFYVFPWYKTGFPSFARASVENELSHTPGNHLVIVHYGPDHEPFAEWVYNGADIPRAKIIWAHDMGPAQNQRLVECYGGRQAWLVDPDEKPLRLTRFLSRESAKEPTSYVP